MRYAALADLQARFGTPELAQRTDPDALAINEALIERALDDAHADIDGALALVFVLPMTGCTKPAPVVGNPQATLIVPPPQLTRWACDLARAYLWSNEHLAEDHPVAQAAALVRKQLQAVAAGKLAVNCPWGGQPGLSKSGQADATTVGETVYAFSPRPMNDAAAAYR